MSDVTNAILTHRDWDEQAVRELAHALEQAGITSGRFIRVDQHATGTKAMEVMVHVAAFNHLDEKAFLDAIRSVGWQQPADVQLFLQRQEESRFTEMELFGMHEPNRKRKHAFERGMTLEGPLDQRQFIERLPALLKESHTKIERIAENPLRSRPWRSLVAETMTEAPWVFEVLKVQPEQIFKEGSRVKRSTGETNESRWNYSVHHICRADLAYRGHAAEFWCDSVEIGDASYDRAKETLSALNPGDLVTFMGKLRVNEDGIWRLAGGGDLTFVPTQKC